jgi:hypothetical protein
VSGTYSYRSRRPRLTQIKLTFSDSKQIIAIEPGPAFDAARSAR